MMRLALIGILVVPSFVHAQAIYQVGNIFALFAGILVAASFVLFFGGFAMYLARLGRPYREEGLNLMQWGVACMFVFIICSFISRWWLLFPDAFPWLFAIGILIVFSLFIIPELMGSRGKSDDDHHA